MRVACPECSAEYDLPPALAARLAEGRTVRCARCGNTWAPGAAREDAPAEERPDGIGTELGSGQGNRRPAAPSWGVPDMPGDPALAETVPRPVSPEPPVPLGSRPPVADAAPAPRAAGLGWAASLLLLVAAAAAAWYWRIELVAAWPPAARVFIALGLAG